MLFSKSAEIKNLVGEHTEAVINCYEQYEDAIQQVVKGCNEKEIFSYTTKLRVLESEADTVRHKIIRSLLEGGLLVDSRKSLMHVIEGIDSVADTTEDIIQEIYMQRMVIPSFNHEAILQMTQVTKKQLLVLSETIKLIVSKYKIDEMTKMIHEIEDFESEVDKIQQETIKKLFDTDLPLAYKMQIREFINLIGSMSDRIEDISDAVEIIMMARKV